MIEPGARRLHVIGHVHTVDEFAVCEDPTDGSTWVVDRSHGDVFALNRDRTATALFVDAFAEYFRTGPPQHESAMQLTTDQALTNTTS